MLKIVQFIQYSWQQVGELFESVTMIENDIQISESQNWYGPVLLNLTGNIYVISGKKKLLFVEGFGVKITPYMETKSSKE